MIDEERYSPETVAARDLQRGMTVADSQGNEFQVTSVVVGYDYVEIAPMVGTVAAPLIVAASDHRYTLVAS